MPFIRVNQVPDDREVILNTAFIVTLHDISTDERVQTRMTLSTLTDSGEADYIDANMSFNDASLLIQDADGLLPRNTSNEDTLIAKK